MSTRKTTEAFDPIADAHALLPPEVTDESIVSYGYCRGHPVVELASDGGACERYASDLVPTALYGDRAGVERPCVRCGVLAEPCGPDPCLGMLPGVVSACCGHGIEAPYVAFPRGRKALHGADALRFFTDHGVGPHAPPHGPAH